MCTCVYVYMCIYVYFCRCIWAVSACFRLIHTGPHLVALDGAACSGSGSHHLNNGVCFWWLRVSITSFRTSFALLLQYFESAVPTDRRAYSSDIDCFGDDWQSFLKQCLHWRPVFRLGGCVLIFSSLNRLGSLDGVI